MEQIGVLVIFALIGLFQLLVRWLRSRAEPAMPPTTVPQPEAPPPVEARPSRRPTPDDEELFVRIPVPAQPRMTAPRATAPRAPTRAAPPQRRRVVGTRAELRRSIVLMEVLGPCRAMTDQGHARSPTR